MPEPRTEAGVGISTSEKPRKIEQRDSREKVLTAFNSAYSLLERIPEDKLTPEERWTRDSIKAAKEKTIDQGKDTFINTFKNPHTGETFSQDERIPTGELLTFLQKKAENLKEYPVGSKKRQDLINIAHIIYRNSRPFYRFSDRMDPTKLEGRVDQELAKGKSKDRKKTIEAINTSLELILPEETKGKSAEKPIKKRAVVKKAAPKGKSVGSPTPPAGPAGTTEAAGGSSMTTTEPPPVIPVEGAPATAAGATPEADSGEPPAVAGTGHEEGGNEARQSERVLSSSYNVHLGSSDENARKFVESKAQMRVEEESSKGFPTHLPQNRILRVGRLIAHGLNPRNWGRIMFTNMKEYYRQIWMDKHLRELRDTNFGATSNLSQDAARRALAEIKSMRAAGKEVVKRMEIGGVRAGEAAPIEIQGPFKDYIVNQVLKPVVSGLKPLLPNEAANQDQINGLENDIQKKLFDYVSAHQNDTQITEFFGRNASQYGNLSEFYASDIMETARKIIIDERADQFQQGQLDNIIHVRIFRATWGEQTEIRRSAADRLMAWAEKNRVRGALINPATVGLATSALTFLGIRGGLGASRAFIPLSGIFTGSMYAALRNNWDLKEQRSYASRQQEAGAPRETAGTGTRREIVERSLMNMATPGELIDGGGQEIIAGGAERQSIADMITRKDYQGLLRRRGEIISRADFAKLPIQTRRFIFFNQSSPSGIGLIKYESREKMEHGLTKLITQVIDIDKILLENNFTPDQLRDSVTPWNEAFIENKREMDGMFDRYKLGSNLAAAGGAAVIGGTIGLGLQEGIAVGGRLLGNNVSETMLEGFYKNVTGTVLHPGETAAAAVGAELTNLYQNGGTTELGNHLQAVVDPTTHSVNFVDGTTHQTLASGVLDKAGEIKDITVGNGTDKAATDSLAATLSAQGLTTTMHETATPSLSQLIHEAASSDTVKTVHLGNQLDVDLYGKAGKVVINDLTNHTSVAGTVDPNGVLTFDHSQNSGVDFSTLHNRLRTGGFSVVETHTPGGTVVDQVLSHSPAELRQQGIIETDNFSKGWNFHVLRHDIVAATGMHTHNELTVHFGQFLNEKGQWITGQKGLLNFGGDVNGDLIPSNLPGVPSAHDPVLDSLIQGSGAIHHNDMVFVVDLNDGRQIMVGADSLGNAHLPSELVDPQTGAFRGIKSIAAAVLADKNGHVIRAPSLIQTGILPEGSTVHSLASVALNTPTPQGTVIDITTATPPNTPGTHFIFDAISSAKPPEDAIIPVVPLGPREPLANVLFLAYGLGYQSREGLGWVPESEYTTRRSKTLKENPQAKLDESQEVADYLSRIDPVYRGELEEMDRAIGSPMSAETRTVITIPAFGEGKIIKRTLEQFLNQKGKDGSPIDPNLFEIIVYENDTEQRPKDETEEQIRQFKAEHPEIKVHYAFKRWTQEDIDNKINTVGNGRRYSCDLALLRSSKRATHTGDLIVVNNDADLEGITPKYIADAIEEFDTQDYLDYVVGKRNLPDWALKKPNIRAGQRMWETFDAVMRHAGDGGGMDPTKRRKGWPGMIGENSAMRASIYAAVGGYGPKAHLAEDQNLGDMIRVARQYDDRRFKYINRLETIKNPRRYLTTMITGRPLVDMYNDYHENKDIRNQNNQQLLSQIPDTFDVSRFQLDADSFYQKKGQGAYGNLSQKEFDLIFQRAMRFMGAGYVVENGHVKITNAERLLKGLGAKKAAEVLNDPDARKKRLDELRKIREERERKRKPQRTSDRLRAEVARGESGNFEVAEKSEAARTHPNKDRVISDKNHGFIGVFDGAGIEAGAEVASRIASESVSNALKKLPINPTSDQIRTALFEGSKTTVIEMQAYIAKNPDSKGMGTTASVVVLFEEGNKKYAIILNAGDSRAYVVRNDGTIGQLSEDHSSVYEAKQTGKISEDEAREINKRLDEMQQVSPNSDERFKDPAWKYFLGRHRITKSFVRGGDSDVLLYEITPTDKFIFVTSDGVHDNLTRSEIAQISNSSTTTSELVAGLVERAKEVAKLPPTYVNTRAKDDDISVAAIKIPRQPTQPVIQTVRTAAPAEALRAEAARGEPKDLLGKVNKTLTETTGTSAHYETSPQELVDYLKTFKLPLGKLENVDAKITDNELVINGSISIPFGGATFDVILINDETGGIRVKRHDLVLSGTANKARGKVEEYIANLNAKLATRINREIDPAWETNKFSITSDKLAIDFKQKPKTS